MTLSITISDEEWKAFEPVEAHCTDDELVVTLGSGLKVSTPLWWYPSLANATPQQRGVIELSTSGGSLARTRRGPQHRRHAGRPQGSWRDAARAGGGVTMYHSPDSRRTYADLAQKMRHGISPRGKA